MAESFSVGVEVAGVKDALRVLNQIDVKARRELTKNYKQVVSPMLQAARALTPSDPPLSGMAHTWSPGSRGNIFPWDDARQDRQMQGFVSGKKPKQWGPFTSYLAAFGVTWKSADAVVAEMSGRGPVPTAKGREMVANLTKRYGAPGRFLWKAYLSHQRQVERDVDQLIRDMMRKVQRYL